MQVDVMQYLKIHIEKSIIEIIFLKIVDTKKVTIWNKFPSYSQVKAMPERNIKQKQTLLEEKLSKNLEVEKIMRERQEAKYKRKPLYFSK